ncbi:phenylalanine--tRNA ligase subunit beta [Candidatus Woesebacteria bacterium]|nr:MAG: phenylalanine--tRNA ligase subunit beta [Candidatus Woesebacteria bacterium]
MNILILDSWLRDYLITNAKAQDIARCLSLCGPSVERINKINIGGKVDYVYDIEVTTNRVDMMSVWGIAREASVILPEFGFKAKLKKPALQKYAKLTKPLPLKISINPALTHRVMGIVIDNIKNRETPKWMKDRLTASGFRSLGALVDITNYVMTEIGHPTHVFDYDLITTKQFVLRESKKNERIVSLENKEYKLPGGDIVIDDSTGQIIDLPGIIGTKNSVVNATTKRVLLFMETNDPVRIRKTSMTLGIRTVAATLNEKGVDPTLSDYALSLGVSLFQKICHASVASNVIDKYPKKQKQNIVKITHAKIEKLIGTHIDKKRVITILSSLGFGMKATKEGYEVSTPSWRNRDITIAEDIVEEVVRIFGYHNVPCTKLSGEIPDKPTDMPFKFEMAVKSILKELGANEVYTFSLVSKTMTVGNELKLSNPLGSDHSFLRVSLLPSLRKAADVNVAQESNFLLFEVANIYIPSKGNLPQEKMTLGGIFVKTDYEKAKGVIETLLDKLNIPYVFHPTDAHGFKAGQRLQVLTNRKYIGFFGVLMDNSIYFEFDMSLLKKFSRNATYKPIPQFPAHIEDITSIVPKNTYIGDLMDGIKHASNQITKIQLIDTYNDAFTFRIWYQDCNKTLSDEDVRKIRQEVVKYLSAKHHVTVKE